MALILSFLGVPVPAIGAGGGATAAGAAATIPGLSGVAPTRLKQTLRKISRCAKSTGVRSTGRGGPTPPSAGSWRQWCPMFGEEQTQCLLWTLGFPTDCWVHSSPLRTPLPNWTPHPRSLSNWARLRWAPWRKAGPSRRGTRPSALFLDVQAWLGWSAQLESKDGECLRGLVR